MIKATCFFLIIFYTDDKFMYVKTTQRFKFRFCVLHKLNIGYVNC